MLNSENTDFRVTSLLKCQNCGSNSLQLQASELTCNDCNKKYPIIRDVPVFLENPEEVKVFPLDHVSNQQPDSIFNWLNSLDGHSLNIGAGASQTKHPKCIEMEYSVYKHTDVVGDAHQLPFQDSVFEAVVAFNVFEHLRNPFQAAQEIFRVLKPGGKVMIHTAFLQPLHEEPIHFYNATKYGVVQWFSEFQVDTCHVSGNFNPAFTLGWLAAELLYYSEQSLGQEASQKLAKVTLGELKNLWATPDAREGFLWDSMMQLPQSVQERFSAGFELLATKPS